MSSAAAASSSPSCFSRCHAGDEPARILEIISPAGFEDCFAELTDRPADAPAPQSAEIAEIAARYGLELDFTSIPGCSNATG